MNIGNRKIEEISRLLNDWLENPSSNVREFARRNHLSYSSAFELVSSNRWFKIREIYYANKVREDAFTEVVEFESYLLDLAKQILLGLIKEILEDSKANKITNASIREFRRTVKRVIAYIQQRRNNLIEKQVAETHSEDFLNGIDEIQKQYLGTK